MSSLESKTSGGIKVNFIPESYESSLCCKSKPTPPKEVPVIEWDDSKSDKLIVKRLWVILNPFGGNGKGRKVWNQAKSVFERENIETVVTCTEYGGHATQLCSDKDLDDFQGVVAIGGDGTISEVINGLMMRQNGFNIPLGLIAGGTGNSFMTSLKLLDPIQAANVIVQGFYTSIDIGKVTMMSSPGSLTEMVHYMFNLVGWGLGVDGNTTAEKLRCCGPCRYDIGALIEVMKGKKRQATVELDNQIMDDDFSVIMILNNQHTGTNLRACPKAVITDGLLDVVLSQNRPRSQIINLFDELKREGSHVYRPEVDYRQVKYIKIDAQPPTQLNVDGENIGGTPATIECLPNVLKLFAANPNVTKLY